MTRRERLATIVDELDVAIRAASARATDPNSTLGVLESMAGALQRARAAGDDEAAVTDLVDAIAAAMVWLEAADDEEIDLAAAVDLEEDLTARVAGLDAADRVVVIERLRSGPARGASEGAETIIETFVDDIEAAAWPFEDPPDTAAITLKRVLWGGQPIRLVSRTADDGTFEFLDGADVAEDDAAVAGLGTIARLDPSVLEVADLVPGARATRRDVGDAWRRSIDSD